MQRIYSMRQSNIIIFQSLLEESIERGSSVSGPRSNHVISSCAVSARGFIRNIA